VVVWAAGVTASGLAGRLAELTGAERDRAGRVTVEPDLTLPGFPDVFAIGDMVRVRDLNGRSVVLPGVAPVAIQQGRYAASVVRARQRGREHRAFRYRDKGNLATIGRASAVADIKGLRLSGFLAWVIWLVVHLWYLIGFQNSAGRSASRPTVAAPDSSQARGPTRRAHSCRSARQSGPARRTVSTRGAPAGRHGADPVEPRHGRYLGGHADNSATHAVGSVHGTRLGQVLGDVLGSCSSSNRRRLLHADRASHLVHVLAASPAPCAKAARDNHERLTSTPVTHPHVQRWDRRGRARSAARRYRVCIGPP